MQMGRKASWAACAGWLVCAAVCGAQSPNAAPGGGASGASPAAAGGGFANGTLVTGTGPAEVVPPVKGFNFSLSSSSEHSSLTGWSTVWTPSVSYRFNQHFSLNATVPWYLSVKNFVSTTVKGVTTYPLKSASNLLGDTTTSGQAQVSFGDFAYKLTATGAFPTGDSTYGLSANEPTYNFTNHLEYSIGPFSPDVEAGIGDSSSLAGKTVKKSYTAIGTLANFQAGSNVDLPFKLGLDLEAYENLPVGNQNVYGTVTSKNKKGVTVTKQVLEGKGVAEDNGFMAELDIPLGRNLVLAGNYQRSLRQGIDTAGIALTWVLRAPKKPAAH